MYFKCNSFRKEAEVNLNPCLKESEFQNNIIFLKMIYVKLNQSKPFLCKRYHHNILREGKLLF